MSAPERVVEVYPDKPVVVDFDPALTFTCVDGCTWCCHHGVLLYEPDLLALADREPIRDATTTVRGEDFVRTEAKDRGAHVDGSGRACYYLTDEGLCALHADHDWKPARCSVFPLHVRVESGGTATPRAGGDIHVSVREDAHEHCEGLGETDRRILDNLEAFLPERLWDLEDPRTDRVL